MHVFVLLYSLHYKIYITFATYVVTEDDRSCMQNIPVFSRNCLYSAALSTFCPKKHLEEFQLIVSVEWLEIASNKTYELGNLFSEYGWNRNEIPDFVIR